MSELKSLCHGSSLSRSIARATLLMLITAIVIFTTILNIYAKHLITDLLSSSLYNTVQRESQYMNLWFDQYLLKVNCLAENDVVQSQDKASIQKFLEQQNNDNIIFDSLLYINRDGYSEVDTRNSTSIYYGDRSYFKTAMSGKPCIDGPMIGRASQKPAFVFAAPVITEQGQPPLGVILGVIFLENLAVRLNASDPAINGTTYIVSPDGIMAIAGGASDTKTFDAISGPYLKNEAIKEALAGNAGVKHYTSLDGEDSLGAYMWLSQRGIGIVTEIRLKTFYGRVLNIILMSAAIMSAVFAAMVVPFALFMRKSITLPLKEIAYRASQLANGHLDERISYQSNNEIGYLAKGFNYMAERLEASYRQLEMDKEELEAQQAELTEKNALLERMSVTDALTGLYNRGYMNARLLGEIMFSQRYKQPVSCIMLDLDFFKNINDTYGHQAGDAVLVQLAKIISENVRKIDVPIRYGGEEFLIICPNTNEEGALMLAERIRSAVEQHNFDIGGGNRINVTVSAGVACFYGSEVKEPETVLHDIINMADQALYYAKNNGRNNVKLFA